MHSPGSWAPTAPAGALQRAQAKLGVDGDPLIHEGWCFPPLACLGTAQGAGSFGNSSSALLGQRQAYPKLLPSRLGCKVPASPSRGIWEHQSPLSSMAGNMQVQCMSAYIQVIPIQLLLKKLLLQILNRHQKLN